MDNDEKIIISRKYARPLRLAGLQRSLWADRSMAGLVIYFVIYVVLVYLALFTANKIKRKIDSKRLNQQLEHFKRRKGSNYDENGY